MLHFLSSIAILFIAVGLYFRRRPGIHLKFMTSAFTVDLALVLYIELTRKAVETVAGGTRPLVWFHAAVSVAVLLLYIAQIFVGRRLLASQLATTGGPVSSSGSQRQFHRMLGIAFCVVRGLNYVTSFLIT